MRASRGYALIAQCILFQQTFLPPHRGRRPEDGPGSCRQLPTPPIYTDMVAFYRSPVVFGMLILISVVQVSANSITPEVLDLMVTEHGQDGVRIEFRPSDSEAAYVIYRRSRPIAALEDLEDAIRIAVTPATESVHFDHPPPGLPYYYAVMAIDRLERGDGRLIPGRNRTINPITVPLDRDIHVPQTPQPPMLRRVPLPKLLVIPQLESDAMVYRALQEHERSQPLSEQLKPAFETLLRRAPDTEPPSPLTPQILPFERDENTERAKGRETTLARIVTARFPRGEWAQAEQELRNLYSVFEEPQVRARALFYLGQTLYFQDRPREAFMSFLLAEPQLYQEVQPWLDAILSIDERPSATEGLR